MFQREGLRLRPLHLSTNPTRSGYCYDIELLTAEQWSGYPSLSGLIKLNKIDDNCIAFDEASCLRKEMPGALFCFAFDMSQPRPSSQTIGARRSQITMVLCLLDFQLSLTPKAMPRWNDYSVGF